MATKGFDPFTSAAIDKALENAAKRPSRIYTESLGAEAGAAAQPVHVDTEEPLGLVEGPIPIEVDVDLDDLPFDVTPTASAAAAVAAEAAQSVPPSVDAQNSPGEDGSPPDQETLDTVIEALRFLDRQQSDLATTVEKLKVDLVRIPNIPQEDNAGVSTPSREEIDAKLQALESSMDRRVAEFVARMDVRDVEQKAQFETMLRELRSTSEQAVATRREVRTATIALLSVVVASALATVFGLAGVLNNMVASYESGRNTATAVTTATEQLKSISDRLDKQASQAPQLPASK
ncbi:hypothetical protein LJR039_005452 [Pseudorhodoferax sp. LjRoot39]|uniref:hypothetical protein n=1 Tax=Pseudorhodoferax sp. LjRoot39 TaxID=3342328 RepID=UPI003ED02640